MVDLTRGFNPVFDKHVHSENNRTLFLDMNTNMLEKKRENSVKLNFEYTDVDKENKHCSVAAKSLFLYARNSRII